MLILFPDPCGFLLRNRLLVFLFFPEAEWSTVEVAVDWVWLTLKRLVVSGIRTYFQTQPCLFVAGAVSYSKEAGPWASLQSSSPSRPWNPRPSSLRRAQKQPVFYEITSPAPTLNYCVVIFIHMWLTVKARCSPLSPDTSAKPCLVSVWTDISLLPLHSFLWYNDTIKLQEVFFFNATALRSTVETDLTTQHSLTLDIYSNEFDTVLSLAYWNVSTDP